MAVISTDRLTLGVFKTEDIPDLIRIAGSRDVAATTITVPHPFTEADAVQWITDSKAGIQTGQVYKLAVRLRETEKLLGYAGLWDIDQVHQQAELSFWLDTAQTGHGYATEAAGALVAYGYKTIGLNRICAHHMARNPASGRILQKIGMRQEGVLRQRVFKNSQFEDVFLWARLASEAL